MLKETRKDAFTFLLLYVLAGAVTWNIAGEKTAVSVCAGLTGIYLLVCLYALVRFYGWRHYDMGMQYVWFTNTGFCLFLLGATIFYSLMSNGKYGRKGAALFSALLLLSAFAGLQIIAWRAFRRIERDEWV